jgi:hypothetical protein
VRCERARELDLVALPTSLLCVGIYFDYLIYVFGRRVYFAQAHMCMKCDKCV